MGSGLQSLSLYHSPRSISDFLEHEEIWVKVTTTLRKKRALLARQTSVILSIVSSSECEQ